MIVPADVATGQNAVDAAWFQSASQGVCKLAFRSQFCFIPLISNASLRFPIAWLNKGCHGGFN
jgi:hypothetical protein